MIHQENPIKFDHLILRVSDFDSARKFYDALFEYASWEQVPDPSDERSIGYRSAERFTLWLEEVRSLNIGDSLGWMDHWALHCESREAVDHAFQFCKSQDWRILTEPKAYPDYGDFYGFSFQGPDGIKLEFVTR